MEFCTKCGGKLKKGVAFCTGCGHKLKEAAPAREAERIVAPPAPEEPTYRATPEEKDSRSAVLGTWSFIGATILFTIPLIGFIFGIIWAASGSVNLNLRNFSRAYLIMLAIGLVLTIVLISFFAAMAFSLWGTGVLQDVINNIEY